MTNERKYSGRSRPKSGPVIDPERPQEGFYAMRLVKDGIFVPVRIHRDCSPECDQPCDRYHPLQADIWTANGKNERDPRDIWIACAKNPISKERFETMVSEIEEALALSPWDPKGNPEREINPDTLAPLF